MRRRAGLAARAGLPTFWAGMMALLVTAGLPAQEPRVERVEFEPGAGSASIEDQIRGYETVRYLLGARAGQQIDITLETTHGATYFNVLPAGYEPGRDAATFMGETGGNHYSSELATDGDVMIEVYMMRSAARRNEVAKYDLRVAIAGEPLAGDHPASKGPWPVDTDASGDLPCARGGTSFERQAFDSQCPFRVKRNSYGATIWVVRPGDDREPSSLEFEDLRILYFEGNQPGAEPAMDLNDTFSTSDGAEIGWDRDEDTWIVNIDGGQERYWIPDAVIWGG